MVTWVENNSRNGQVSNEHGRNKLGCRDAQWKQWCERLVALGGPNIHDDQAVSLKTFLRCLGWFYEGWTPEQAADRLVDLEKWALVKTVAVVILVIVLVVALVQRPKVVKETTDAAPHSTR